MRKFYLLFFVFIVCCSPHWASAQDFLGINNSTWGGVHTLHINPANVVSSRMKVDINLVSMNMTFGNNYASMKNSALFNLSDTSINKDQAYWDQNILVDSTNGRPKSALMNLTILGPSFMFNITPKDAIAFTSRVRGQVMAEDMDEDIANIIYGGLNSGNFNIPYSANNASVRYNLWAEYGLSYGRVILDQKEHYLSGGITLKFLQGLGSAYATVKDYNLVFSNQDTIQSLTGNLAYGNSQNDMVTRLLRNQGFNFGIDGAGMGADIGFVYEWRPKWEDWQYGHYKKKTCEMKNTGKLWEDPYTLKASVALTNIGAIRYTKGGDSRDYILGIQNLPTNVFNGVGSAYDISQVLDSLEQAGQLSDKPGAKNDYMLDLPLSLNIGLDYHVIGGFYMNMNANIAFNQGRKDDHRMNLPHSFYFTPRYDNQWFGAYMPIGYRQYSGLNWGLSLRLGPVIVGSGDIFTNLIKGETRGIDLFVGAKIPIPHMKPRDRDNDLVLDKFDKCKDTPGKCEFNGCPDRDNDGIQDTEDDCPDEPGLAEFKGCPDTDSDGIMDKEDKCPTDAGPKELQGCPDRDFDGVIDREDDCPDERGLVEFNGCPDTDGDGLMDKADKCPLIAGPIEKQGCPDSDGDGIIDPEDACPTEFGLPELKGCPFADTDKDGIKDIEDKCPEQPGPIENGGCPYADSDGDGIIDLEDKCPLTPGVRENFGCPAIEKEEAEVLKRAFDNLEFNTGKSTIRSTSFDELDELAELMLKKPEYKLLIEGHTDNVGKRTSNMTLSKNRATAVKTYLTKKGVPASRFVVEYFGPDKPIDTNDTEEGRQRNRRVEMTIVFD